MRHGRSPTATPTRSPRLAHSPARWNSPPEVGTRRPPRNRTVGRISRPGSCVLFGSGGPNDRRDSSRERMVSRLASFAPQPPTFGMSVQGLASAFAGIPTRQSSGQVVEELLQASFGCFVPLDFAWPSSRCGVVDELLLHANARTKAGCVVAGGEELRAGQHEVALARPLGQGA